MSYRKLMIMALACMLFVPGAAFSASQDKAPADDPFAEEAKPAPAKQKKSGREVQAKPSIEAEAPEISGQLSPQQLQQLSEIYAATALAEAQFKLETIEARRLEQQKKMMEAAQADVKAMEPEPAPEPITRVFPMPGGNPQVTAILGGNRKALEATLKFPNGVIYEVSKGTMLEGGYVVSSVTGNGVIVEKNGLMLAMPISQGEAKGKPWDSGVEQGTPTAQSTPPPPPSQEPQQQGRRRR